MRLDLIFHAFLDATSMLSEMTRIDTKFERERAIFYATQRESLGRKPVSSPSFDGKRSEPMVPMTIVVETLCILEESASHFRKENNVLSAMPLQRMAGMLRNSYEHSANYEKIEKEFKAYDAQIRGGIRKDIFS